MPLYLYQNIFKSGSVPKDWEPIQDGTIKYPVRNHKVREYLRTLLSGKWQKVIKKGNVEEVHYFEHESGQVAGTKFFEN